MTRRAQRPATTARNRRQESRVVPRLECLEDRTLLSAARQSGPRVLRPDPGAGAVPAGRPGERRPSLDVPGAVLGPQLSSVPGLYDVRLSGLSVPAALAIFQADPRVQSVEPDYYLQVTGTLNDPQFGNQWGLQNTGQLGGTPGVDVHATQAWAVTTGSPGVTVAQIDTGVDYNNADLYQNIWINQAEIPDSWFTKSSAAAKTYDTVVHKSQIKTATPGVITFADLNNPLNKGLVWDNNGDGRIDAADLLRPLAQGGWDSGSTKDGDTAHPDDFFGWNFVANNNNPFDDSGHGTNVAGILAGQGNNAYETVGLDWNVPLQELKAFDANGVSSISLIVQAIDYSIQHGAKISNNSWSVGSDSTDLLSAVTAARSAGQIFVAAAGNDANPSPNYPARYAAQLDNVVSVAAVDRTGKLWSSSDYGATTVTLAGPGVDIFGDAVGGGFSDYTGTSQAVPFVTGTLALVWGLNPTWTYKQVIADVTSTVTPLASLNGKTITGGLVNAGAAVGAASNGGGHTVNPPAPKVLSTAFGGPDGNSLTRVVVTFDQVMDLTTFTSSQVHLTNPSGQSVPVTARIAPGSDGHQIEIDFAAQTAAGKYTLSLGGGIRDAAGAALSPYTVGYAFTPAQYVFKSTTITPIPDLGTAISTITVSQDITIGSLQVTLNITHPYDSDLFIFLEAPDGTEVLLVNRRGGSGHNFVNTVLSDNAGQSIRLGTAPFTGTFQAESPLSIFNGKDARGVWRLWVEDLSAGDVGVINGWTLTITPAPSRPAGVNGDSVRAALLTGLAPANPVAVAASSVAPAHQTAITDAVFASGGVQSGTTFGVDAWQSLNQRVEDGDWTLGLR